MGMDLIDLTFRLEKSFGIAIDGRDWETLPKRIPFEVTAGEMHDWVVELCGLRGVEIPWSSWNRIRLELSHVVNMPPNQIRRASLLVRALGFKA
jgi:hypothetical protein